MMSFASQISLVLLLFLSSMTFQRTMCRNHWAVRCNQKDRWMLQIFKQGVIDPSNRLSSWSTEEDCCAWTGIQCDNITGRVSKLDLKSQILLKSESLRGEINLSLLELEFLNYLDLSWNYFESISIPPIRDAVATSQRHDNQSLVTPPFPLANFSNLHYLDLSFNYDLHMNNLDWLSRLSSLKYLNLSLIDLSNEVGWLQSMVKFPSLSELQLSSCKLNNIKPSLQYVNFTSLVTLVLSDNHFNFELPHWLFNLSNDFSYLDLGWNSFKGRVPVSLLNLRNLKYLDLSRNKLKGPIPDWLGQHEHLQHLDLSYNLFYGSIPSTLGNLSSLTDLDISSNLLSGNLPNSLRQLFNLESLSVGNTSLSGLLSEMNFSGFSNLKSLDLSLSAFEFDLDPDWIPPFQLDSIDLSNTIQGPKFPSWIYTQRSLTVLDLSSSRISSIDDGDKFWSFISGIESVYLSNNSISGDISNVTLNSLEIFLDRNDFTGRLPRMSANVSSLGVSHNSFSGAFDSWESWKYLTYINLGSNKLAGEIPRDLSKLKSLRYIDLGKNNFSGNIPIKMPQRLEVLILRSNQFVGNIPSQLCNLSSLRILDLAHNKLSGSIPHCVYDLTQMVMDNDWHEIFSSTIDCFTKGLELEYKYNGLLLYIDISANKLSGEIPSELFKLIRLQSLNLSHNCLTGTIPKSIGNMKNLESLDLSHNQLFGEIPQSMSVMTFLESLNVSYNNFTGQIPIGTQLQSFDPSSYIGNPELCGAPLKNCAEEEVHEKAKQRETNEDDDFGRDSFYRGMGIGFAVGFWGVCGSQFLIRTWRHAYFRFLAHVWDRLYVVVALNFKRFNRSRGVRATLS